MTAKERIAVLESTIRGMEDDADVWRGRALQSEALLAQHREALQQAEDRLVAIYELAGSGEIRALLRGEGQLE